MRDALSEDKSSSCSMESEADLSSVMDQKPSHPQKPPVQSRSKSTDEVQQAKKLFHISQKSLPGGSELEKVKEGSEENVTPASSTEELQ
ncbi:hypothetical protein DNTS_014642 [Danionella cerebrum]|uniref:Uncharacterized protein n=1 Tax=Danionella cerebrum TaxID=2873325 RepID=A0A553R8K8_9TELE|nr:hypothetical protein DNTS_014642 [Danionella translucida]